MKNFTQKASCIANFISHVDENNFLTLYYVADSSNLKPKSICYLTRDEALECLQYLSKTNRFKGHAFIIIETCVYMA